MNLWLIMFVLVCIAAFLSVRFKNNTFIRIYTFTVYAVIAAMLCLRFGQGTDYFSYRSMFDAVSTFDGLLSYHHGEPLWLFLCYVFNNAAELLEIGRGGGGFTLFIAAVSLAEMAMIWNFIRRCSANFAMSVMLFLPVTFMIYFCNLLRQGLAMSIFMCYGTRYIERKEWSRYIFICIILSMIHTVSMIYFAVPVVLRFRLDSIIIGSIMCAFVGMIVLVLLEGIIPYIGANDQGYVAPVERLLSFMVICVVYRSLYGRKNVAWWMKLYCFGTGLYFVCLSSSLLSSRLAACFKALEMIIVPALMTRRSKYRFMLEIYFFVLSAIMFAHSIYGEAVNGGYASSNPIEYPYVSIFNARDIYNYRMYVPLVEFSGE